MRACRTGDVWLIGLGAVYVLVNATCISIIDPLRCAPLLVVIAPASSIVFALLMQFLISPRPFSVPVLAIYAVVMFMASCANLWIIVSVGNSV